IGALGVMDRVGCRITVHDGQVGSRLSLEPLVMQEQFAMVDAFQGSLGGNGSGRQVRRWLSGVSVLHAARAIRGGNGRTAASHLAVARHNGVSALGMMAGFAQLLMRRARWLVRGPFVPGEILPDAPLRHLGPTSEA